MYKLIPRPPDARAAGADGLTFLSLRRWLMTPAACTPVWSTLRNHRYVCRGACRWPLTRWHQRQTRTLVRKMASHWLRAELGQGHPVWTCTLCKRLSIRWRSTLPHPAGRWPLTATLHRLDPFNSADLRFPVMLGSGLAMLARASRLGLVLRPYASTHWLPFIRILNRSLRTASRWSVTEGAVGSNTSGSLVVVHTSTSLTGWILVASELFWWRWASDDPSRIRGYSAAPSLMLQVVTPHL